jgi:hypothetical protein
VSSATGFLVVSEAAAMVGASESIAIVKICLMSVQGILYFEKYKGEEKGG